MDPPGSSVTEPGSVPVSVPYPAEDAGARVATVLAGHRHDEEAARGHLGHQDPLVRSAALSALSRMGALTGPDALASLTDPVPVVRRRAVEATTKQRPPLATAVVRAALIECLMDADALVVDVACWSMGETEEHRAIGALSAIARGHADIRCRESAVAALGAIGDPAGLPAVLEALRGKPTLRRRAAVALAGFEDDQADVALRGCLEDRDWQVRQVAEALLDQ